MDMLDPHVIASWERFHHSLPSNANPTKNQGVLQEGVVKHDLFVSGVVKKGLVYKFMYFSPSSPSVPHSGV